MQRALDIREPFICESGAAVYIPRHYYVELTGMDEGTIQPDPLPQDFTDRVMQRTSEQAAQRESGPEEDDGAAAYP